MNKKFITWEEFNTAVDAMEKHYLAHHIVPSCQAVFGLPRGGLPIAVALSHRLDLPLLMNYYDKKATFNDKILIVDDIADSGSSLKPYENHDDVIFTMHHREGSITIPHFWVWDAEDDWIVYPWERQDSETLQDYLNKV